MPASHRKHVDHCLDCGAPTPGAFCPACGQEAVDASVTFRDQMSDFFAEVLSLESRLPQTVKTLLTRPGALTRAYNSGQRVRFVTPLKLYLFASVAFFLVLSFSASRPHTAAGAALQPRVNFGTQADPKTADEFDAWVKAPANANKIPPIMQPHIRALIQSPDGFAGALVDLISKATMALVPIHALLLKLLYWLPRRPRHLYGEHLVFSLHVHSFGYVAYGLSMLLGVFARESFATTAETIAVLGIMVYAVLAARTAYAEGLGRSALKMALAGVGYVVALALVLSFAALIVFFEA